MNKALLPRTRRKAAAGLAVTGGAVRRNDGVFVWDVASDAPAVAIPTELPSDTSDPEQ